MPDAFRCSISNALVLDLNETVEFSKTSETFKSHKDKIMYGLDDNQSIYFYFRIDKEVAGKKWSP